MSRDCRECEAKGSMKILGVGFYGDTIEVECQVCGEGYEIEPDGFGEGAMEFVEAMEIEMRKDDHEEE